MRIPGDVLVCHDGGKTSLGLRCENIAILKHNALMEGHTGYLAGDKSWAELVLPAIIFFKGRASQGEIEALKKQGFSDLRWHWI